MQRIHRSIVITLILVAQPLVFVAYFLLSGQVKHLDALFIGGIAISAYLLWTLYFAITPRLSGRRPAVPEEEYDRVSVQSVNELLVGLSSDKELERLAAIYAVERLVHDRQLAPQLATSAIESFLQQYAAILPSGGSTDSHPYLDSRHTRPAIDVQAAVQALGRMPRQSAASSRSSRGRPPNLSRLNLRNIDLSSLDLAGVDFRGSRLWNVKGTQTRFDGADLREVDFTGAIADEASFVGALLEHAHFDDAVLVSADFSLSLCSSCSFRDASAPKAIFKEALLAGANFGGADLTQADFTGAVVYGVNFRDALTDGANITEAKADSDDLLERGIFLGRKSHG